MREEVCMCLGAGDVKSKIHRYNSTSYHINKNIVTFVAFSVCAIHHPVQFTCFSHQQSQEPCETDVTIIILYIDKETEA